MNHSDEKKMNPEVIEMVKAAEKRIAAGNGKKDSFVLFYRIDGAEKKVTFLDFEHYNFQYFLATNTKYAVCPTSASQSH